MIAVKTIHLVACCGKKLEDRAPAKELYQSQLFKLARAVVEASGEPWFILSALHQLVHPDTLLYPYDHSLKADKTRGERQRWAGAVLGQLETHLVNPPATVFFWAGRTYCEPLATLLHARGYNVSFPLMGLGIGRQLAYLTAILEGEKTRLKVEVKSYVDHRGEHWESDRYQVTREPDSRRRYGHSGLYLIRKEGRDCAAGVELHSSETFGELTLLLEVVRANS